MDEYLGTMAARQARPYLVPALYASELVADHEWAAVRAEGDASAFAHVQHLRVEVAGRWPVRFFLRFLLHGALRTLAVRGQLSFLP